MLSCRRGGGVAHPHVSTLNPVGLSPPLPFRVTNVNVFAPGRIPDLIEKACQLVKGSPPEAVGGVLCPVLWPFSKRSTSWLSAATQPSITAFAALRPFKLKVVSYETFTSGGAVVVSVGAIHAEAESSGSHGPR